MDKSDSNYSRLVLLLCVTLMCYSSFVFYPRWQQPDTQATIAYDVAGYYWYLPSIFIYKDLKHQEFAHSLNEKYKPSGDMLEQGFLHEKSGNYVQKYTSGMAMLYLPAFCVAHAIAHFTAFPSDGLSTPYQLALQIWGLLFSVIGLYYLRRLLLWYFTDKAVAIVLFLLVFGTNYLNYSAIDVGMSHSWLFTLYVLLLINTHRFYETNASKYAIRIGLLIGLMTLIRPTEIIALLIPLLWGVESLHDLRKRLVFFSGKWLLVLKAVCCIVAVLSVQLCYWKYVSGAWIVYSYQDQGFNLIRPHALAYSWSYRAGWLRYSPMMLLSFVGFLIYPLYGKNRWAVMSFFVLNYYIVSAWNIWDYGGFSGRAMIQSYPVLLFPMALLVDVFLNKRLFFKVLLPFVVLFVYINIWWTYQAHRGDVIDALCTTKEYYWKMVGRWHLPERYAKLKDTDELPEKEPAQLKLLYRDRSAKEFCIDKDIQNNRVLTLPLDNMRLPASDVSKRRWIRVSADFRSVQKEWSVWLMPQFIVEFRSHNRAVKTRMIRTHRFMNDGDVKHLFIDVQIPDQSFDTLNVSYWNANGYKQNCLNNISVSTFVL